MTDKSDWPQWLKDADTANARVEILPSGLVIWRGGVWCGGVWRDGVWCDGVWRDGVWCDGLWRDGMWCGGVWYGGDWRDGWSTCNRASYTVLSDGKGNIRFGCQTRPRDEWIAIAEGRADPPHEAPKRGTQEWRLLVASLRAQIAYDDALAEQEPG